MSQEYMQSSSMSTSRSTPKNATPPLCRKGHPQHISPSSAKRRDAPLICPFVHERKMLDLSQNLHAGGGRVSTDVLFHILKKYVDPVMRRARKTYAVAQGEMATRPILSHLWPIFWSLVPRGPLLEEHWDPTDCVHDFQVYRGMEEASCSEKLDKEQSVLVQDLVKGLAKAVNIEEEQSMSMEEQMHVQLAKQSTMGDALVNETLQDKKSMLTPDSLFSLCAYHEDRMMEHGAVDFSFSGKDIDTYAKVWRSLLDAKDADLAKGKQWTDFVVWQLMAYASVYGIENAKEGRFNILHLLGMHLGVFTMAQLHLYGTIRVENGKISKDAFDSYKMQEEVYVQNMRRKDPYFFVEVRNQQDLERDLKEAMKELTTRNPDAKFVDAWYIVGNVYVEESPMKWDTFDMSTPLIPETMFVIECLLEVLIGRKTWRWTIDDVENIYKYNESEYIKNDFYELLESSVNESYKKYVDRLDPSSSLPPSKRRKVMK